MTKNVHPEFQNRKGSAPAPGVAFRALAENRGRTIIIHARLLSSFAQRLAAAGCRRGGVSLVPAASEVMPEPTFYPLMLLF
jgi:hypothetical protein